MFHYLVSLIRNTHTYICTTHQIENRTSRTSSGTWCTRPASGSTPSSRSSTTWLAVPSTQVGLLRLVNIDTSKSSGRPYSPRLTALHHHVLTDRSRHFVPAPAFCIVAVSLCCLLNHERTYSCTYAPSWTALGNHRRHRVCARCLHGLIIPTLNHRPRERSRAKGSLQPDGVPDGAAGGGRRCRRQR